MKNVEVLIWGLGAMGGGMADMLLDKKGVEIVGICDLHPERVGKSVFDILGRPRNDHPDVLVEADIDALLQRTRADVCLLATDSFTAHSMPKMQKLMEHGLNIVSTAEEMAYPQAQNPDLAAQVDELARKNGVSVLGTGINPGLIMDLLVVLLTGACREVHAIKAERVNSLSPFGPAVMEEQGVGRTPAEFAAGIANGSLAGHVGFPESVGMITDGIGWKLDGPVQQTQEAIVSSVPRSTQYISIEAGDVAGCDQRGIGYVGGKPRVKMIHPQQIEPELEDTHTGDYITIEGTPDVNMSIKPEVPGGIGTIAMCVNMIPQVINATPGLKTMLDLPVPRAIMGDMRDRIEER
ncbi:MAG: 2,4-diaminopentanoate dehydrogenase [Xanthomonadales bacterium]|jgi:4-hydroxy-tetrahydrodipicolinate reductase|nr:2,4-diaminopentanoate dehydrogenase [Xanthomonadales bacterium]